MSEFELANRVYAWLDSIDRIDRMRLPSGRSLGYHMYMKSLEWQSFRNDIIASRGQKCEKCGSVGPVQIHHLHYNTLGHEGPEDVQVLCVSCHRMADQRRKITIARVSEEESVDRWAITQWGWNWNFDHSVEDVVRWFRHRNVVDGAF